MNKKKLLIICDSHGTDWGCMGYAIRLKTLLSENWDTTVLAYPGKDLKKIHTSLLDENIQYYDAIVLGVGNPDVHPRMPRKIISLFKAMGISSARDSYFSVPPKINLSYLLRLPFFIFRILVIRLRTETYTSIQDLKKLTTQIIDYLSTKTTRLYILPIFKVCETIYGKSHNINADEINEYLFDTHQSSLINEETISESIYRHYRNFDFFHFNDDFQEKLTKTIANNICK